jgi:hypothetical protein
MASRITFAAGREIVVAEPEDEVVAAIRRDYPNPVKLSRADGLAVHVNWDHVVMVEALSTAV